MTIKEFIDKLKIYHPSLPVCIDVDEEPLVNAVYMTQDPIHNRIMLNLYHVFIKPYIDNVITAERMIEIIDNYVEHSDELATALTDDNTEVYFYDPAFTFKVTDIIPKEPEGKVSKLFIKIDIESKGGNYFGRRQEAD